MRSYQPKLLRVNLSKGVCQEENIPDNIVFDYIGGRGFGIKYLYEEVQPKTDPLGPDNKLLFTIGPLSASGAFSTSRWLVTFKSPLTDTYFRSSGGANFGAWMKFAGLDMIIVEGAADKPVYLYIGDGHYELKDAGALMGKDTIETQKTLKEIHGPRISSVCIGPVGERLVRYAAIMSDSRCAGRGGCGTVMGAKKLKAITINPASRAKKSSSEFKALIKEQIAAFQSHPIIPMFSEVGTTSGIESTNVLGLYPALNFREGSIDGWQKLTAEEYRKLKVKNTTCYGCMTHCGNEFRIKSGPYAGITGQPEYETINMFTGTIGSSDIAIPIAADSLCDRLGMDTLSAGHCIGFAYELFEKGILTKKDTDGLELVYGNQEAAMELLKKIANREGLGDILAEGVKRAAEQIGRGATEYAMHIKGLEMPGYDPRSAKWHGLGYVTSPCGANHNIAYSWQELLNNPYPRPVDRLAESGYASSLKFVQDLTAGIETAVLCTFMANMQFPPFSLLCRMLASTMGIPRFTLSNLVQVGERIWTLERAFNIREGFTRMDDTYPKRFTTEPLRKAGAAEGAIINNLEGMLEEYYCVREWDSNGVPTIEKLTSLGLENIGKDIVGDPAKR